MPITVRARGESLDGSDSGSLFCRFRPRPMMFIFGTCAIDAQQVRPPVLKETGCTTMQNRLVDRERNLDRRAEMHRPLLPCMFAREPAEYVLRGWPSRA